MKKILILSNNDAGLYKFRKELLAELIKKYEVHISLPNGEYIERLKELGCKYIETSVNRRGTNPLTDLKLILDYINILRDVSPDLVLTYTIKPNIYGGLMCRMWRIPYLINVTGLGSALESGGIIQRISMFLYRIALKKANCIFFQNRENTDLFIQKKIVIGDYKLIPGSGVNLEYYQVLDYPSENDTIHFMFIARVMKEKGIDQYLDAAEFIKKKYPHTMFHILGFCEEAYEDKLNEMQSRGIIQYHGMQDDVRKFHKISHCTIHPTYYPEGMSNVLLESAACGRPVITTNRSGCRETVEEGISGFTINPKDSRELIEKIEVFINLPYRRKKEMGLAGRNKVEKEFDRRIVINAYLNEVNKCLVGV